ncbi:phosphate ABC transporter permease subunit PstC [Natrinema thermotolerans]|uniref:Phosphate transport system permease protein n=1 Tax=Natrinema thermotolerans TaxID=121872 RepID=A0AAF0PD02_9EURY|nr:phosphate ABC transporter permease subunit PstC [Natrinema thermotolerans]ELZ12845.1 phosphate ABC transporter, inner membrane subunit PstC [Natrinema thermotolerans DSM 11552]QCC59853.1 phosphate ABC transporter permease subunit PstC [Natrinema thermotolerans]WMT06845.1 phosphate ABC transporter permease subunit PstC [Natrinema thermotolerans]
MSQPDFSHDGIRTARGTAFRYLFMLCALLSILTTVAIILTLLLDAIDFFAQIPLVDFLTGTRWSPTNEPIAFGVLPLISGTLVITIGSAMVALPIGLLTAIYLSEYASDRQRAYLKPALEVLAGVPTVVYGYFALVYVTPAIDTILPVDLSTFNALSASIMVGIMIIPMVSSISEDAMSAVPDSLRQASYGLGATKFTVSTSVVVPAALSGIFSSFILALSRAIGETMIVAIAAGQTPRMIDLTDPAGMFLDSIQPMTSAMVQIGTGDIVGQGPAYKSLFAVGLTLFVITFVMNLISELVASRYREVYR